MRRGHVSSRGTCSVCGRNLAIKLVNNRPVIRRHGTRDGVAIRQCAGAGQPARREEAVTA